MPPDLLVHVWRAEARFGQAATLIRWLHDEVLPRAVATERCVGAEGFAGDDDHRVALVTRWSDLDACEAWRVGPHRQIWREQEELWWELAAARRLVR